MTLAVAGAAGLGCAGEDPSTEPGVSTDAVEQPTPVEELSVPGTTITYGRPRTEPATTELRVGTGSHTTYAFIARAGDAQPVLVATGGAAADDAMAPARWLLLAAFDPTDASLAPTFADRGIFTIDAEAVQPLIAPNMPPSVSGWFSGVRAAERPGGGMVVVANIVAADDATPTAPQPGVLLWITRDGQLDVQRGDGGIRVLPRRFAATDIMVDVAGRTWVAGRAGTGAETIPAAAVVRIDAAGGFDTSITRNGMRQLRGSALEPVLIGQRKGGGAHLAYARPPTGDAGNGLTVTAVAEDGSIDRNYGTRGSATLALGSAELVLRDLTELRTGGLRLLAGVDDASGGAALVGAVDRRGTPVASFGSGGVVAMPAPEGQPIETHSMQLDDAGTMHVRAVIREAGAFGLLAQRAWVRDDGALIDRKQRLVPAGASAEQIWTADPFTGDEWRHPAQFIVVDALRELAAGVTDDDVNMILVSLRSMP